MTNRPSADGTRTTPPTQRSAPGAPEPAAAASAEPAPHVGPLGRIGRFAYRNRWVTVAGWLAALGIAMWLTSAFGGKFTADYSAPDSDSHAAQQVLADRFAAQSGDVVTVVAHVDGGVAARKATLSALLADVARVPHVVSVDDPFSTPGGVSPDGGTMVAHARLDVVNPADMPKPDTQRIIDLANKADSAGSPSLRVGVGGQAVQQAEQGAIGSEGIGMAAAAVILLLTFGSLVAAGLPIGVAAIGLAVSSSLTGLVIRFVDAPDWSTSLAAMMGIGIGIDYALLMVTRFREWRAAGLEPEAATVATLDTAGRSVIVAGTTVLISMFGLFAMGLSYMRGAALVTILGVFLTMLASVTLFPALLGFFGRHVDRLRLPIGRRSVAVVAAGGHVEPSPAWRWWSGLVQRHRVIAAVAGVALLVGLAAPFLGVRFGFPDQGNNAADKASRRAYDMTADGFGPGANGPLLVAITLDRTGDKATVQRVRDAIAAAPGVAVAAPPQLDPAGDAALVTVIPANGPGDKATEDLVRRLRDETLPGAGSGFTAHVGGVTATSIDTTNDISGRLPLLIAGVVLVSMLLLLVSFRSIAVALKAAVMNLLSVAAAYGVVALVLEGGWAGKLVGIETDTPLPAFVPVLMFAVLFGLSMDYEVFLVSRMREAWTQSNDNARAVTEGLASTGRVITAAAAIMIAVFGAFVPSADIVLKVIGIGMASAILVDATIVRMLLVPAVMHLLGRVNWWMPAWLGRLLPELHVEGRPAEHMPVAAQVPRETVSV